MAPRAAVLVLVWGKPPKVLIVRKNCGIDSPWRCHAAFPGGHIENGETPVDTALREAWEEAWVYPDAVRIVDILPVEKTRIGGIEVYPVLAVPSGPLCTRPNSPEVDQVFWLPLNVLDKPAEAIEIPWNSRLVSGYRLPGGAILWGLTLRVLRRLWSNSYESGFARFGYRKYF